MRRGLIAVSVMTLVAGCASDGTIRDETGRVVAAGEWSVFDLRPADCIGTISAQGGDVDTLPLVPCEEPHTMEVYSVQDHPDSTYPGAGELASWADRACLEDLEEKLGLTIDDVPVSYLIPTENNWDADGGRSVVCVLFFGEANPVVGSLVEGTAAG